MPLDDLCFALGSLSAQPRRSRLPGPDRRAPQTLASNPDRLQLFRIGDAVAARNIHAAAYDALRLRHVM